MQTVQSFPLHSFPNDYWRFSADGLKTLFSEQAGFRIIEATHDLPCKVISEDVPETEEHPAYIYATILAQKMSHPKTDFRYSAQKMSLETGGGITSEGAETTSSEIATGIAKSAHEDKRIQLSLINTASYKRLKRHWFFGLFIRLCDHLVNYPAEAKMFSKLGLVEINKRYERSVSHWLFGPVIRWGNAAEGKSPAPKQTAGKEKE